VQQLVKSALALFALFLMPTEVCATDHQPTTTSDHSIRFVALPYLNAFHYTSNRQTIDSAQTSGPRLAADHRVIIPLPTHLGPISTTGIESKPLWIRWPKADRSKRTWHAPALTPALAALALTEQKRKARLAKRMADRAFYFGYDTNNDALK